MMGEDFKSRVWSPHGVPNSSHHLQVGAGDTKELRFQVRVLYVALDTGAGTTKTLSGVGVEAVQPYRWF